MNVLPRDCSQLALPSTFLLEQGTAGTVPGALPVQEATLMLILTL